MSVFPGSMDVQLATFSSSDGAPLSLTLTLAPQSTVTPLADNGTNIDTYASSLWFQGALPPWTSWPSTDPLATLQPTNGVGAFFSAAQLELFECGNVRQPGYGANCSQGAPAPAPAPANATHGRGLRQFQPSCELFLREVRVPATIALQIDPPRGCLTAGGPRCAGNWSTKALYQGCGSGFTTAVVPVSESQWIADVRSGPPDRPAWCANWSAVLPPSAIPPPAVLSVRSEYDPYVQAATITGCAFNFGPSTIQYAAFALNLIAFGVTVVALATCSLAAVVGYAAAQAAARGEAAPFATGDGTSAGGSYGSTAQPTGWYSGGYRTI